MTGCPAQQTREPVRYVSVEEDSGRWVGFPYRAGDIVISTRSKSGTTWMQTICALLIFQTSKLPEPMATLSPWLDWRITQRDEIYSRLASQQHRRFIKTHTPLDGIPLDCRVTYIVVARHPLDMAVSFYHQGNNLDRDRIRQLTGEPNPDIPTAERQPLREWLLSWIDRKVDPRVDLESLHGALWHLSDAWHRRMERNVILVHYDELLHDLEQQMRRLADLLEISVPEATWPHLVAAATFESMSARAEMLAPNVSNVMRSCEAFFRQGRSGSGRELLSEQEFAHYRARTAELAPADLLAWLHREDGRAVSDDANRE